MINVFKNNTWASLTGVVTFSLAMWFSFEQNSSFTAVATTISLVIALIAAFFADMLEFSGHF